MIELYKTDLGNHRREYYCLAKDVPNLPKDDEMYTGCTAYCVDTGDLLMYDAENKAWEVQ